MNKDDLLEKLLGMLSPDEPEEAPKPKKNLPLAGFDIIPGASIAGTGTLENYTREQFHHACVSVGLYIDTAVKKSTRYLVVGTKTQSQSKIDKAKASGTIILTEPEFEILLRRLLKLDDTAPF